MRPHLGRTGEPRLPCGYAAVMSRRALEPPRPARLARQADATVWSRATFRSSCRQRPTPRLLSRPSPYAARSAAGSDGPDRHERVLQRRGMRRVHGAARRPGRDLVPGAGGGSGGRRGRHDRRTRGRWTPRPAATVVHRRGRGAMRVLHPGHDHVCQVPADDQSSSHSGRDPEGSREISAGAAATAASSAP